MNDGPVLIVDDDKDDWTILKDAWNELGYENPLIFFSSGNEVIEYLKSEKKTPFIILCDVNIPKMDGFELKRKILEDDNSNYKSIPFVFWSSAVSKAQIQRAYDLGVNGFFLKEDRFDALKQTLKEIVNYWKKSVVPE
jgi:CheY-like chemotaxis protein